MMWCSALRRALGMKKLVRGMAGGVVVLEWVDEYPRWSARN